jgi:uncharacterized protein with HEPN domain
MPRDADSLRDMIIAAQRVIEYVKDVDRGDFDQDLEKLELLAVTSDLD